MNEMAYSSINNGIKEERTTHLQALLHAQLSAEDSRNIDNNDSLEELRESPLDFSIKRKSRGSDEVSGSDSVSSPASSLNDTMGHIEDRKNDNDVFVNVNNARASQVSPPDRSPYFRHKQLKNENLGRQQALALERNGQNHSTAEQSGGSSLGLPNVFHDIQMSIADVNMIANTFPAMSALMDHRKLITNSPKCLRSFKPFPTDPLSLSVENTNLPHYLTSLTNFENSAIMQGLGLSSEEVLSAYKQQVLALMERERYIETLRLTQEQYSIKTSTVTASSPSIHIPTSLVSAYVSGENNGVNSDLIGSAPIATSSSSHATSPSLQQQHSNKSNLSSRHSISSSLSHLPAVQSLTAGGRRRPRSLPDEQKDEAYWERRRKNNEAAKRSRDTRRAKEDQIAIRAAILEQENLKLRVEIAALKNETAKLRCALYNS